MNDTIKVEIEIEKEALWQGVFGGGWENASWWHSLKYGVGGSWENIGDGTFTLRCEDPEDEDKTITKKLTIDDLAKAYGIALSRNYHHCGSTWDIKDSDLCVSDGLLQIAFFGDVMYS